MDGSYDLFTMSAREAPGFRLAEVEFELRFSNDGYEVEGFAAALHE